MSHRDLAEHVEQFFDRGAPEYDRSYADPGIGGRILRKRAAVVLDLLGDPPGEILDAGMGGGIISAELDRRGWSVHGVDVAPAMVALARARLPHLGDRLRQATITELPFSDSSFDAVVATGVLEFTGHDLPRAVAELVRVLRPAGTAVMSFPNRKAPVTMWRGRVLYPLVRIAKRALPAGRPAPPNIPIVPFGRLEEALADNGLRVEVVLPVGVRPGPAAVAERLESSGSRLARFLAAQLVVRAARDA